MGHISEWGSGPTVNAVLRIFSLPLESYPHVSTTKQTLIAFWHSLCCNNKRKLKPSEAAMVSVRTDNLGDLAIVECEGRILSSPAALTVREAVMSQTNARTVVLDLSEVDAIGGGGVGMLTYLQQWARTHDIKLKLFNPSRSLRQRLEQAASVPEFEFVTIHEVMAYFPTSDYPGAVANLDPLSAGARAHS
jgi:anti-anti-sigma regulatory factor